VVAVKMLGLFWQVLLNGLCVVPVREVERLKTDTMRWYLGVLNV